METLTYKDLTFELRQSSNRKTVGITVEKNGKLIITYPPNCPKDQLQQIIESRSLWIYQKLQYKEVIDLTTPHKKYVTGEGFYYLGRSYRLKLIDTLNKQPHLRLYQGRFLLHRSLKELGRECFIEWYRAHLSSYLKEKIPTLTTQIGVSPQSIQIRELKNRWGSCNSKGDIYFHWRIILLPAPMIAYILVHELVHLSEPHHKIAFWDKLEAILPDYQQRKQWLAEHGKQYDL